MKKVRTPLLVGIGYCIPFVFLSMWEDARFGTLWFYFVMIACLCVLCCSVARSKSTYMIFVGNLLSFISSNVFFKLFQTEKWQYYFKPFSGYGLIVFESIVVFVLQMLLLLYLRKKR